jgi:hypothetical protein
MAECCVLEIIDSPAPVQVIVSCEQGPAGPGIPSGGLVGDFLRKTANGYDWVTPEELIDISFETYSKNLKAVDYSFVFDSSGNLDHIDYSNEITKTFIRNAAGAITSITLSGVIPPEVTHTTKNFAYDSAGVLVSISYS